MIPLEGSAPGFKQQGTIDWVALAKVPVTFSVEVLARLSKAGIDPFTVVAGQAVCSSFILPPRVHSEVVDHLSKLRRVSLYGKVAWFGFGLRHVLYDLVEKDEGVACLALCGCLSESYSPFLGAQVFRDLSRCQNVPSELSPGL